MPARWRRRWRWKIAIRCSPCRPPISPRALPHSSKNASRFIATAERARVENKFTANKRVAMKAIQLRKPGGFDNLDRSELDIGKPGPGESLVRVHASSLNFHDYAVVSGMLATHDGVVPMSDAGGVVVEVGAGVAGFKAGDHVVSVFYPDWDAG